MKRKYILILLLLITFPLSTVNATTLKEVKNKLYEIQNKKSENTRLTKEAENKITSKRNAIVVANDTITENENKVEDSKTLVAESEEQIKLKQKELQEVITALEYSNLNTSEVYMDYVFSSSSITDMMQRQAVVEQIVNKTQSKLDDLKKLIENNKALQVKLADDNVNLTNSISEYEKQLDELEKYIDSLATIGLDYDDQIKAQQSLIKIYENAGCKDNDNIDDCYYSKINGSANFSKPLNRGRITQAWNAGHGGMDLGGNTPGTTVYAPASGTIVYAAYKTKCGGNIIYMHSSVNGQKYTVEMAHLRSINVSNGQIVTKGQPIATVGGDSSTWYYDKCTTGTHLHYAISYGYYFTKGGYGNEFYTFKSNTKATGVQSISGFKNTRGWTWSSRY